MYILDTNVISELRKANSGKLRNKVDVNVVAWASSIPVSQLFLSVISVMELETGVLLIQRKDKRQGAVLRDWLDNHVLKIFQDKIIPIDTLVAQCCAKLHVPDPRSDRDALIAASGLIHKMTIVTRNTNDFKHTKVKLMNPWEAP
ncbi:MAG: type II toxin-antitoxin system VapC family toxin [Proteobacteria bacterium]|nr:type II toxin-antitoxin system VapC family toxin [Pseudomonadota bacterium]